MSQFRNISGQSLLIGYGFISPKTIEDSEVITVPEEADESYTANPQFELVNSPTPNPVAETTSNDSIKEQ